MKTLKITANYDKATRQLLEYPHFDGTGIHFEQLEKAIEVWHRVVFSELLNSIGYYITSSGLCPEAFEQALQTEFAPNYYVIQRYPRPKSMESAQVVATFGDSYQATRYADSENMGRDYSTVGVYIKDAEGNYICPQTGELLKMDEPWD